MEDVICIFVKILIIAPQKYAAYPWTHPLIASPKAIALLIAYTRTYTLPTVATGSTDYTNIKVSICIYASVISTENCASVSNKIEVVMHTSQPCAVQCT